MQQKEKMLEQKFIAIRLIFYSLPFYQIILLLNNQL